MRPVPVLSPSQGAVQSSVSAAVSRFYSSMESAAAARVTGFIGDSYSSGSGASTSSKRWTTMLCADQRWTEVNVAQAGTGYGTRGPTGYTAAIEKLASAQVATVIVAGGRNDTGWYQDDPTAARAAIEKFYVELHTRLPTANIIAVDPLWDSSTPPAWLGQLGRDVQAAVIKVGGTYAQIGQPLANHRDWIVSDGVHPNDAASRP